MNTGGRLGRIMLTGARHPLRTLLFLAAMTAGLAAGLPGLQVDTGFSSLIADSDPDRLAYRRVAGEFGSDDRSVVYVRDPALWTPAGLAALERLRHALLAVDSVAAVDDLFTLRDIRGSEDTLTIQPLLDGVPQTQEAAERAREAALANPLAVGRLLAPDGHGTALMVSLRRDGPAEGREQRVHGALEAVVDAARGDFAEVFQVGGARITAELQDSLFADLRRLGLLSAGLLVATIVVFLRSGFAAFVPLVTSALAILWTFGMMGWTGIPLNILSAMLPSLVVVIGSTEDTHMVAAYLRRLGEAGEAPRRAAVRFMMGHMAAPLLLTIVTTALGFASNLFSGIGLIRDFSMAAAFAILANGLITVLLVPLLLQAVGPRRNRVLGTGRGPGGLTGLVVRVFSFGHRHLPRTLLVFTAGLCAFFIYQAQGLDVTNDPMTYFRADSALVTDSRRLQQDLAGTRVFYVMLESRREKAFLEPANLERLAEIQAFLKQQGIFDRSTSVVDLLARVNRAYHGGDEDYATIPGSRELVAQYLLFFHRQELGSYLSHDYRRANIVVRHQVSDSGTLNRHIRELKAVVRDIAGPGVEAHVVGENLMVNAAAESLMVAQVKSLGVLLGAIFVFMAAMFTSIKGGIIALVPAVVPIILMFGVMGLLDIPLNPGTAMVAVIAIGIAIDGTIHLFSRYNDLCRRTADYDEAVATTVREEATPVVATSIALALGFGVLLFSEFTLIAQFGALAAATMLFAVFANLLITPIIMARVRLVGLYQILAISMQRDVLEKSPLFRGMSGYQMRKAILISELHEFEAGELLVRQGTVGRSMFLILSGEVEVVHHRDEAHRRLMVLLPGQVFGEIGFVQETERTADVRALTPVSVLRFDFEKIRKDLKYFPNVVARLNLNISAILGERLAATTRRYAGRDEAP